MITLASQLWIGLGIVGFLFISLMMVLIVLIQKPQGGGLSGAFGSSSDGGAGQTAFGAKTGDVLTTMTISIFVLFLVTAAGLNYALRPSPSNAQQPPAASSADGTGGTGGTAPAVQTQNGGSVDLNELQNPPPSIDINDIPEPAPTGDDAAAGDPQPQLPAGDPDQPTEDPAQPDGNTDGTTGG